MEKKIIIVNKNDQIIGRKARSLVKKNDIYRVSALWLKNTKGESLLALRAFSKRNNPGKWGPAVAGTVEEGENYEGNIVKEIEEELGLRNIKFEMGPKLLKIGEHNHFTQWFTATVDKKIEEFKVQKTEVEKIKWFSQQELEEAIKNNPSIFLQEMENYLKLFL
jgi:isopentenyldiphosphate isomerase